MIATLAEVVTPKSCAITPTRNFIWPSRSILLDCTLLKWIMKSSLCCIKCTPCCVACSCDHNEQNCDILSSVKRTYHLAEHYMLCVCNNGLVRHAMSGIFFLLLHLLWGLCAHLHVCKCRRTAHEWHHLLKNCLVSCSARAMTGAWQQTREKSQFNQTFQPSDVVGFPLFY